MLEIDGYHRTLSSTKGPSSVWAHADNPTSTVCPYSCILGERLLLVIGSPTNSCTNSGLRGVTIYYPQSTAGVVRRMHGIAPLIIFSGFGGSCMCRFRTQFAIHILTPTRALMTLPPQRWDYLIWGFPLDGICMLNSFAKFISCSANTGSLSYESSLFHDCANRIASWRVLPCYRLHSRF